MIRVLLILAVLAPAAAQAKEATPVKRQAVSYPPMAAQFGVSARCAMTFDVNGEGATENICGVCNTDAPARGEIAHAIANIFVNQSVSTIKSWEYTKGAPTKGVRTTLTYQLAEEDGSVSAKLEKPAPPVCNAGEIS